MQFVVNVPGTEPHIPPRAVVLIEPGDPFWTVAVVQAEYFNPFRIVDNFIDCCTIRTEPIVLRVPEVDIN